MRKIRGSVLKSHLGPFVVLSRIFGLFPYKFDSLKYCYWSLTMSICLNLSIAVALCVLIRIGSGISYDSFIMTLFRMLTIFPCVTSCILCIEGARIGRNVGKAVMLMFGVEKKFKFVKMQTRLKSRLIFDATFRIVAILISTYCTYNYVGGKMLPFFVRLFGSSLTHLLQNVYELQFLYFVRRVTYSFVLLRKRLRTSTAASLVDCHKDLSAACQILEKTYNRQNFLSIINSFVTSVLDFYVLCITRRDLFSPLPLLITTRVTLRFYQVFILAFCVERVCDEARKFDDSLMSLLLTDPAKSLVRNDKIRFHLFRFNTIRFSGGEDLILDRTFLHTVAALFVNYLIIMVQFGGSDHGI